MLCYTTSYCKNSSEFGSPGKAAFLRILADSVGADLSTGFDFSPGNDFY
jgi:CelD/BcsL family acetyltransferase involved in cellulose biosynthesis